VALDTKKKHFISIGRDSSVGIATRYGLDGPGFECMRRRDLPHPFRPALRPTQPPTQCVSSLLPAGKAAGAYLGSRLKTAQLYLYPSFVPLYFYLYIALVRLRCVLKTNPAPEKIPSILLTKTKINLNYT